MKILELTNYSSGICGVFNRVRDESIHLSERGHEVKIFSSNLTKGASQIASQREKLKSIEILRFPTRKLGGESFMSWHFENEALKFEPDVIIAHAYRHLHTTRALKLKKKLNCKVFLVTHAPFVEKNTTRSFLSRISVKFYDYFVGKRTINKFDKIIKITKWESSYLNKLGVKKDKIAYIPNGIPEEFFTTKKLSEEKNKILFLGRISPIKNLEVLISALAQINNKKINLEIVGPAEEQYYSQLKELAQKLKVSDKITFSDPIYDLKKKIMRLDSAKIFVLPSRREAMPQALIEAMARGKIVISSDNPGSREIIKNNRNGYLFRNGDKKDLVKKINNVLKSSSPNIKMEALNSVKEFNWTKVIRKIEKLL